MQIKVNAIQGIYNEKFYQKVVEKYLSGEHKRVKSGITDVTNDTTHAEIKRWEDYKQALGQILSYDMDDPKEILQVYLFGKTVKKNMDFVKERFNKYNITLYTFTHEDHLTHIIKADTNENMFTYSLI